MSEIRSVSVHLDADVASYIAKMRLAGAETDKAFSSLEKGRLTTLNRQLTGTATRLDKVSTSASKVTTEGHKAADELERMGSKVTTTSTRIDNGSKSIDKYSGRLSLLVSGLGALGPALVPIGAAMVPLVTTATADLGFLAAGAGVTKLAFHGLGTALNAFNKASLQPTAANIAAAQLAMDKLPPSAQAFVLELHRLNPELTKLRESAASGIFPGLTAGLTDVTSVGPLAQRTVHGIALAMGALGQQAGQAVAGPEGRAFLRYFGHEAPLALHQMGQAAGYGADGVFRLVKDFTPLTHGVNAGIVALARNFDQWATSLGKSKDFESFLAYIEANGPKVIALLGNVGSLFGNIVQAAAPLGGPTLDALNLIVKALDLIASSPLATPLVALLQVSAILKLASAGMKALGLSATIGLGGIAKGAAGAKGELSGVAAEAKSAGLALRTMGGNLGKNAASGVPLMAGVDKAGLANLAKGVGLVAGVGIVASGVAGKIGATNTATMALVGSMAGPLGTAVGATVGAFEDWRASVDSTQASIKALQATSNSFDLSAQRNQIALTVKSYNDSQASFGNYLDFIDHSVFGGTTALNQQKSAIAAAQAAQQANIGILSQLFTQLNGGPTNAAKVATTPGLTFAKQMAETAARAQPAMDALGISVKNLDDAAKAGDLGPLLHQIVDWTNNADSAKGRTDAVAAAFVAMGNQGATAADRVTTLSSALDALVNPMLDLQQTSDAFQKSLNDFTSSVAKHSKALRGNSDAAIQNRTALEGLVTNSVALIKAQAAAGGPGAAPKALTQSMIQQRQAIIQAATAAGLNKDAVRAMIAQFGLTPKLIKTTLQLEGVTAAEQQLNWLTRTRVAQVNVQTHGTVNTTGGRVLTSHAAGGYTGDGGKYEPAGVVHRGEVVIPADLTRRDWPLLKSRYGHLPGFDSGGFVPTTYHPNPPPTPPLSSTSTHVTSTPAGTHMMDPALVHEANAAKANLHALGIELAASTKILGQEQQARQSLVSAEQRLVSSVASSLRTDIYASTGSVWDPSGGFDPLGKLHTEITGDRDFDRLLHQLHRRGVRGGAFTALAQTGSVTDARTVAAYSNRQLHRLTDEYRTQQRLSQQVGQYVGQVTYAQRIAEQTAVVKEQAADTKAIRHEQHDQTKRLAAIEKTLHASPKATGQAVGKAINGSVTVGARRARRP